MSDSAESKSHHISIDPIFAAIERHRTWDAAYAQACEESESLSEKEAQALIAAVNARACDAAMALAQTIPQTAAGIRAMLAYFTQDKFEHVTDLEDITLACMRSAAVSPALRID